MADLDARVRAILDEEEDDDLVDYGDSPLPSPAKPAPAKPAPAPVVPPARSDAPSSADAARAAMERARADADAEALRIAAENLPDDDDDDEDLWDGDEAADAADEAVDDALDADGDLDDRVPSAAPTTVPPPQLGEKRSRDPMDDDVDMMDVEPTTTTTTAYDENAAPSGTNATAAPRDDDDDEEMRDQHTFVPLEESEVVLAERICRRLREHKKHLVRLLIAQFGAALCEGALEETIRVEKNGGSFVTLDGAGGVRRRLPGGVFIATVKSRAPPVEFKAVMKRAAEIDKRLKKQLEARGPPGGGRGPPARKRPRVSVLERVGDGALGDGGRGRGRGRGGRGGERGRRGGRGGRGGGGGGGGRSGRSAAEVTTYAVDI